MTRTPTWHWFVDPGGAAESAGVQAEDILLSADTHLLSTVDALQEVMVLGGGASLEIRLWRDGAVRFVPIRPRQPLERAA